jgi:GT2 family glycosyltransferase
MTARAPVQLLDIEVGAALPDLRALPGPAGRPYRLARCLVRVHGRPVGELDLALNRGPLSADDVARQVDESVGSHVRRHLAADGLPEVTPLTAAGVPAAPDAPCRWRHRLPVTWPLATVVVTTCGRPDRLRRTLGTLQHQTYPKLEVLVVDNRPGASGAPAVVAELPPASFRLVTERRPGLSRARNAGLAASQGEVVAFTDDDVDVDPDWVGELVAVFSDSPRASCATGLILPSELDTPAQLTIEEFGGFAKGFHRRTFDLNTTDGSALYPYTAGRFGSGANSAFRTSALRALGGFADDLGAGTPARGGEDLDIYLTVLRSGGQIVYEPAAIIRHQHRRSDRELRDQIGSYGVGLSAVVTKRIMQSRLERREIARRLPIAARYLLSPDSAKNEKKTATYPRRLTAYELAGIAIGPAAYLRSRRQSVRRRPSRS